MNLIIIIIKRLVAEVTHHFKYLVAKITGRILWEYIYIQNHGFSLILLNFVLLGSTVTVIIGVLIFIVGLVGGFASGVLVVYCCVKWQSEHHPPPSPPAPLYEEIVTSPVIKDEVELQLRDNVAYGQVK